MNFKIETECEITLLNISESRVLIIMKEISHIIIPSVVLSNHSSCAIKTLSVISFLRQNPMIANVFH